MATPPDPRLDSIEQMFAPEVWNETMIQAKSQIRKRMKALRGGYSRASLATRSQAIVERLLSLDELKQAQSVALFWPMIEQGEVDLRALDTALRARGTRLFYPFMHATDNASFRTGFALTSSVEELAPSAQGFHQPTSQHAAQPGEIDLVLVPALAADTRGHRIGYGAGYYDATLSDVCPPGRAWIVAYHFQLLAELPVQSHDIPCDGIVTDSTIVRAQHELARAPTLP